jgi:hypothetical protein
MQVTITYFCEDPAQSTHQNVVRLNAGADYLELEMPVQTILIPHSRIKEVFVIR